MTLSRRFAPVFASVALAVGAAVPAGAAGTDDALSLVPPEAASVGLVRLDALRASPLAAKLFEETDDVAADGDAARFLAETGLRPKQDVDVVVVAGFAGDAERRISSGLVLFEGRFDPARLEAAMEARGAVRKRTPHGDYLSIQKTHGNGEPAAIAIVSSRLIVAGTPSAVTRALEARESGGSGFLRGQGIGRHFSRVSGSASAWAIVDAQRFPFAAGARRSGEADAADALVGAMKSVTLFVFHATVRGDSLDLAATGLSANAETRELLEDALKGVVAMWRLAVHEKTPELVPVLRRFEIENDGEGVTISGTLPASVLKKMAAHSEKRAAREY